MPEKEYNFSEESIKRSRDFGTAIKAFALITKTFRSGTEMLWDETFLKRLKKLAIKIINTGPVGLKGNLQFPDGNISLLQIEFNRSRSLFPFFGIRPKISFDKTDFLIITLPKLNPQQLCRYPSKATSIVIRFVCGIFHFDLEKAGQITIPDLELPVSENIFPSAKMKIPLQAAENSVVSVAMCVYYKSGIDIINLSRYKCGAIIHSFNIINGKISTFVYPQKPEIPPSTPSANNLNWEINEE